jgi:ATP/maltotriose-dependent transcriptional regulator MalT
MRDARSVSAWSTALAHADNALVRTRPEDAELRATLLADRADLLAATGDPSAIGAYAEAIGVAPQHRRTSLEVRKAFAQMASGDVSGAAATLAALEPAADPSDRIRQHVIEGQLAWLYGDMDAAERAADSARGLALVTGNPREIVEAITLRSAVAHGRGAFPEQIERDLFSSAAVSTPELVGAIHDGYLCVTQMFLYGGKPYGEVASLARHLQDVADRTGARRGYAFATELLGEAELLGGDLARAESSLARAEEVARSIDARGILGLALQRRAEAAIARGDRDLARALLDEALAWAQKSELCVRHLVQRIHGARILAANDREQALAIVDETESHVTGPEETCMACTPTFTIPAALACARAGDLDRAQRYLGMSHQIVEAILRSDAWRAMLDEVRGAIALHRDQAEARACFAKAAGVFERVGQKRDAERCRKLSDPS